MCRSKTVLHLGCGDAIHFNERIQTNRHLHLLINSVAKKSCGVDIKHSVIERLRTEHSLYNLYAADVEKINVDFGMEFDVICAGEIIEHLNNPGLFVDSTSKYMSQKTLFICIIPNMFSLKLFLHSVIGKERTHPDHCLGFTFSLLETMLSRHGF